MLILMTDTEEVLIGEMAQFENLEGRLFISNRAHLNLSHHSLIDQAKERMKGDKAIGTTGKGIGPAYADKISRSGRRMCELKDPEKLCSNLMNDFNDNAPYFEALGIEIPSEERVLADLKRYSQILSPYITDTTKLLWQQMDEGKKVFPNEGVTELRDFIEDIRHSTSFAMEELQAVFNCDGIDRSIFPTIDDLKKALDGYAALDGAITIQDEQIKYDIPKELLDRVNSHYDGKDLMAAIGGMIHQTYSDQEYRKQRCIEIYGKLI